MFPTASDGPATAGPDASSPQRRALAVALRYVGYRPRTVAEVRRRLARDFEATVVEATLTLLESRRYLDDAEYARQWRGSRERRRPRGAFLLRRELRAKGVAEGIIDEALEGVDDDGNAYRAGQRQARRWLDGGQMPYQTYRRRMGGYLQRRGFSGGTTRAAIQRLWDEFASHSHTSDGD